VGDVGRPLEHGITGRREQQLQYQSEASPVDVMESAVLPVDWAVYARRGRVSVRACVRAWWRGVDIDNKSWLHFCAWRLRCPCSSLCSSTSTENVPANR